MKSALLCLPLLALFACSKPAVEHSTAANAALNEPAPMVGFDWPVPAGWSRDSIPFPLSYAPELPYTAGVEEIRFAPKFFDATADTYWSYSFAWVLDDMPAPSAKRLTSELTTYYTGLAHAVDPDHFDATAHHAEVTSPAPNQYAGTLQTVDAFGDGRALHLVLSGETFACGAHRVLIASASPQPTTNTAIWQLLEEQRKTFHCAK